MNAKGRELGDVAMLRLWVGTWRMREVEKRKDGTRRQINCAAPKGTLSAVSVIGLPSPATVVMSLRDFISHKK
jgi:hypothetical protein